MTTNFVNDLLSAPLDPDWSIEGLAEQLLTSIAAQPEQEFILDAAEMMDRQSRRLIRPLLACLANMSAAESGTSDDVFGADLSFQRMGPAGSVSIFGQFKNTQGNVRITLRRSPSSTRDTEAQKPQLSETIR